MTLLPATAAGAQNSDAAEPFGGKVAAIVGLTCIGAFIGQLDASIVQLALPRLANMFRIRLDTVSWVSLAYLLAFAAFLPLFGRLCQIHGRRRFYMLGYGVFTLGSALCALAPGIGGLILFRVFQGIGGAMLGANSIAILVASVSPAQRGRAMGFFSAAQALGVSLGPALGGLLLEGFGWRAIFWVTVPAGLLGAALAWRLLEDAPPASPHRGLDRTGAVLLMPAILLVVLALNEATLWGLASARFLGAIALGLTLLLLFLLQERRSPTPLIDPALLGNARFILGAVALLLAYALLYGLFFTMAFALVRGYHEREGLAGLRLAMVPAAISLIAPFSSRLVAWRGISVASGFALTLCAAGLFLLAIQADARHLTDPQALVLLALFGAGLGLYIAPATNAAVAAAPPALAGEAGALLNLMRVLGTSLGVASATATLSWASGAVTHKPAPAFPIESHHTLFATEANFALLLGLVLLALLTCLLRDRRAPPQPASGSSRS